MKLVDTIVRVGIDIGLLPQDLEYYMSDPVNHPSHYKMANGAEVISVTENLNFCRGSAVKYICRAGEKNPDKEIEDLEKARWYITREIKRLGGDLEEEEIEWYRWDDVPCDVMVQSMGPQGTLTDTDIHDRFIKRSEGYTDILWASEQHRARNGSIPTWTRAEFVPGLRSGPFCLVTRPAYTFVPDECGKDAGDGLPCIRPQGHTGSHKDARGTIW